MKQTVKASVLTTSTETAWRSRLALRRFQQRQFEGGLAPVIDGSFVTIALTVAAGARFRHPFGGSPIARRPEDPGRVGHRPEGLARGQIDRPLRQVKCGLPSRQGCVRSVRGASRMRARSGKGACGQSVALRGGGRRRAPTPLRCSVSWPRRRTRFVRCAHCAQTAATSQTNDARCARGPRALRFSAPPRRATDCPHAPLLLHRGLLRRARDAHDRPRRHDTPHAAAPFARAAPLVPRGRRCLAGAISGARSSAGPGSARAARFVV